MWVYTNVGRVLVSLETCQVRVSESFLIPDPVCFFYYYFYNRPGEGFKKLNFFVPRFQSAGFKTLNTNQFSKMVLRQRVSKVLLFRTFNFLSNF